MALFIYPATPIDTTGLATSLKQDDIIAELQDIEADIEASNVLLTSIDGKDFATETTLAAQAADIALLEAKDFATETTLAAQAADVALLEAKDFATETTLAAQAADIALLEDRLAGSLVPETHDYVATTYVAAGNGVGEIETVTYKTGGSGGTTVATLTLTYDANDKLSTVTRS